jgi:anti-anti-sigma factor
MRVDIDEDGTIAIATISGEIDLATGSQLTDEVLAKMPDACTGLVVDLGALQYIDSAGVRSLFEIATTLDRRDQPLAMAVPEESLLRSVLKITQVEEVATICATRDEALAAVRGATA